MADKGNERLLGAYLIVGEDELKRQRVLERLRKRVAALGDLEFNHDEFDGDTATGTDIAAACNTLPFASEMRLVEVRNGDGLKAAEQAVLVSYLSAPCQTTVLAFSAPKLAKNTKLYKAFAALGKQAVIDCSPMKRYELVRAIRSMAVGYGFTLTESAASLLVELAGEDTVRLDFELQKLSAAAQGNDPIGPREVEALVARTTEAKPWELVDAVAERNLKKALVLLGLMEDAPLKLLAMCTARFRELACVRSLAARGESARLAEALGMPAWRVKNHGAWMRNYSDAEIRRAFSSGRDCEQAMKTGAGEEAFVDWLIAVMG